MNTARDGSRPTFVEQQPVDARVGLDHPHRARDDRLVECGQKRKQPAGDRELLGAEIRDRMGGRACPLQVAQHRHVVIDGAVEAIGPALIERQDCLGVMRKPVRQRPGPGGVRSAGIKLHVLGHEPGFREECGDPCIVGEDATVEIVHIPSDQNVADVEDHRVDGSQCRTSPFAQFRPWPRQARAGNHLNARHAPERRPTKADRRRWCREM